MTVAASAAVVLLSTVLFPQMAVDGAVVAANDDDKLFEVRSIFLPGGVQVQLSRLANALAHPREITSPTNMSHSTICHIHHTHTYPARERGGVINCVICMFTRCDCKERILVFSQG